MAGQALTTLLQAWIFDAILVEGMEEERQYLLPPLYPPKGWDLPATKAVYWEEMGRARS